jgi:tRNA G46 methylase TrmB
MASWSVRRGSAERCNAGFDDRPDDYDALRSAGHMAERRADHFAALVAATPGTVVEIGSGTGTLMRGLAARFPDRRLSASNPCPATWSSPRSGSARPA